MSTQSTPDKNSLEQRLRAAARAKAGGYTPRTHHLDDAGEPVFINRLILENSPYLLQHAHNPVDWYAWGSEAFAAAEAQDKPVFLSIGYSTCHWCHVMEAESFDNPEIARLLNQDFIAIKLDREQHPDIDDVYMTAVQIVSGHGGWPMSNFLMHDGRPFFGATYFPPGQFAALLKQITNVWHSRRDELEASADRLQHSLRQALEQRGAARELDTRALSTEVNSLLHREDPAHGGLAGAPKFPQEPPVLYWLHRAARGRNTHCLGFVSRALEAMACGGLHDQVGGGFHRYSVDARWLVPHFEKMLYNQSQLGAAYLQAWQLSGNPFFLRVLTRALDYVLREMQIPAGGFYSATDADSEDEEGKFFVWTFAELQQALDESQLALLQEFFDISREGNFEGANILAMERSPWSFLAPDTVDQRLGQLDQVLLRLREIRSGRIPPLRDDKLIVAWASAMAATLARAGQALQRDDYLQAAERALGRIWDICHSAGEGLRRISLGDEVSVPARLEDHANLAQAMIILGDIRADRQWLVRADRLMNEALEIFQDPEQGGFFNAPLLEEGPMVARSRSAADGATIAAVATALDCLVALHQRASLLAQPDHYLREPIDACIAAHGAQAAENPPAYVSFLRAVDCLRRGPVNLPAAGAAGRVIIELVSESRQGRQRELELGLQIAEGWHLAASETDVGGQALSPLQLGLSDNESHWQLLKVDYPAPSPAGDYRGRIMVSLRLQQAGEPDLLSHSTGLAVRLQACSDQLCLARETLELRI